MKTTTGMIAAICVAAAALTGSARGQTVVGGDTLVQVLLGGRVHDNGSALLDATVIILNAVKISGDSLSGLTATAVPETSYTFTAGIVRMGAVIPARKDTVEGTAVYPLDVRIERYGYVSRQVTVYAEDTQCLGAHSWDYSVPTDTFIVCHISGQYELEPLSTRTDDAPRTLRPAMRDATVPTALYGLDGRLLGEDGWYGLRSRAARGPAIARGEGGRIRIVVR